jgi:hypothetical protein
VVKQRPDDFGCWGGVSALREESLFQGCGGLHGVNEKAVEAGRELNWGKEEVGGRINTPGGLIGWIEGAGNVSGVDHIV